MIIGDQDSNSHCCSLYLLLNICGGRYTILPRRLPFAYAR
jgi:hypothetical protein